MPRAGIKVHSRANAKLEEGLSRLGAHCGEIPRNSDTGHACGHCAFGCAYGAKQDGTATFLADAAAAGARVLTGERCACHLPCHALPVSAPALLVLNTIPTVLPVVWGKNRL